MLSTLTFIKQQESITYCADCTCISWWYVRKTSIFPTEIPKLTPRKKVLVEKPLVPQLAKKFPVFYHTRKLHTPFGTARKLSLSSDQSSPLSPVLFKTLFNTDMRRLTTGIRSEKCVVRRFRRCANVIECTYTNLDSIAYYTPSLYIAYCS